MAGKSSTISVRILGDSKGATRAVDRTSGKLQKFQDGLTKVSKYTAVALGGLGLLAKSAGDSASELQQAKGAVESVFGSSAGKIDQFAKKAAGTVGLAQSEYSNLAAVLGSQLKNLGVDQSKITGTTDGLITKGADLAATFGGSTADAVEALTAAFRGETDPIEKYGISIKQADIEARMASDGTDKLTGAAAKAAKTQATLALISEQSADATGQFAREQDSAAGSAQIAAARYENAKAALGDALLPVMSKMAEIAATMATFVQKNATAFGVLAAIAAALGAAILIAQAASVAYSIGMGVSAAATGASTAALTANRLAMGAYAVTTGIVRAATATWAAVQWALNAAMSANPIALVVIAIAALVAGIIYAWNNVDGFKEAVVAAWNWIKDTTVTVFDAVVTFIGDAITNIGEFFTVTLPAAVQTVIDWLTNNWPLVVSIITGPLGALVVYIVTHWTQIKTKTVEIFTAVMTWIRSTWNSIKSWLADKAMAIAVAVVKGFLRLKNKATRKIDQFKTGVQRIFSAVVRFIKSVPGNITRPVVRGFENMKSRAVNSVNRLKNGIKSKFFDVVWTVKTLPGKIVSALGNMGSRLRYSGRSLIRGFINGIKSMFGAVGNAAKSVVRKVRNFFPFSPAKEGPFSGTGYTTYSGKALVGDFAQSIVSKTSEVRAAADKVAEAGMIDGRYNAPKITAPSVSAARSAAAAARTGATGTTGNTTVQINVKTDGTTDPDAMGRRIVKALDGYYKRRGKTWQPA